jgi:hypothetical protein
VFSCRSVCSMRVCFIECELPSECSIRKIHQMLSAPPRMGVFFFFFFCATFQFFQRDSRALYMLHPCCVLGMDSCCLATIQSSSPTTTIGIFHESFSCHVSKHTSKGVPHKMFTAEQDSVKRTHKPYAEIGLSDCHIHLRPF